MSQQHSIQKDIFTSGIGLHSGRQINVWLRPAPAGHGLSFRRLDLSGAPALAAVSANVGATTLATTLGQGENSVSTVEHLMAALSALGVDNAAIEVDGPELPIFDGSAARWVELIHEAGLAEQNASRRLLKVTRPFEFRDGDKSISVRPASRFSVEAHIDFGGLIGRHCFYYVDCGQAFSREISRCRTFCQLKDVQFMQSQGLALGGSLDNAVVVGENGVLNPGGLRYDDELVRHKILDFIGDLAMAGAPVLGHFVLHKPGHELNSRFLRAAQAQIGLLQPIWADELENTRRSAAPISLPTLTQSEALAVNF